MAKIGIVTDTTCCIPPGLIKEYDIRMVPVALVIDGKVYKDQFDITPAEFWKKFKVAKELPTTAAANPEEFLSTFNELAKTSDNILCILVSKILSATNNSAVAAKQMFQEQNKNVMIEIIDSKCSAGALGFLVLEAARAARAGKSMDEVVKLTHEMLPKVTYITVMESMKYLIKGGRAPKTAYIGELLQIKPLITNNKETGLVDPVGRVRGKKKAMQTMVDMVGNYAKAGRPLHMMVHFTDNPDDGEELKKMVTAQYNCAELYVTDYSPVMSCHVGPVTSLGFYVE